MSAQVKGWCPSAHRPMMSGDGLLVRVTPYLGWLSIKETLTLCDLAEQYGNGVIDLTSRARVQIRGVVENNHSALLEELINCGLVDASASREARRSITIGSDMIFDPVSTELAERIEARLDDIPDLPAKMGIAINLYSHEGVAGDFRFESSREGLILRADGVASGRKVTSDTAVDAMLDMMQWFLETGGAESGRMARHVSTVQPPNSWQTTKPKPEKGRSAPGIVSGGLVVGVPFGALDADQLRALAHTKDVKKIGVTPWRSLRLEGVEKLNVPGITLDCDPLLDVSACSGAPACAQASVPTRPLARALAGKMNGSLHVSGCEKGCARQSATDVTLVGREGRFDLVQNGTSADTPIKEGLSQAEVLELFS